MTDRYKNQSASPRALREAETKADSLFKEIETRELIRPGISEKELNDLVYELAF